MLSQTQIILLESYQQSLVSKRQEELQSAIRDAIKESEDQLPAERKVVPLLRIRYSTINYFVQYYLFGKEVLGVEGWG